MNKEILFTENAPAPVGPYSQAVKTGNMLYCSGEISIDPKTNEIFTGDVQKQTEMVMENVRAVLTEAGLDFKNIIKTMIFLTNMDDFAKVNEVYAKYFPENPPARSCVAVCTLPKNVNVEVEVIAQYS